MLEGLEGLGVRIPFLWYEVFGVGPFTSTLRQAQGGIVFFGFN